MEPVQKPLPLLENADEEGQQWLARLFPQIRLEEVFFLDHVIERLVLLVHSLTESKLPLDKVSLRTASGPFRVQTEPEKIFISAENSRRYAPFTRLAEQLDSDTAVAAYQRLYPLLQQAYEELGVSTGTFHQRLLEVIDHLLATPEVKGPIALVQPHVLYQFADPELEALSAGQKILLRIGPENAAAVKGKLRELRSRLVR
ncbi:MAG: DUF3014 domain-containing protein [Deltaproteobacteria bacterium]|nr:DUF3014 domain-containing protein [Deltaproteobacteria bacterium]